MRQRNWRAGRIHRASRAVVFSLAAAGVMASVLRGWPEVLYAQAPPASQSTMVPEENVAAFRRISNKVLCQCGSCSYIVLSCNHLDCSSATYIRRTIKDGLAQGKSEEVILAGFVDQYGPKVLPEPPRVGFGFMAWLMPFVALTIGIFAVMYALSRLRRGPAFAGAPATEETEASLDASPELVEKYREQIEHELRKP